MHRIATYKSNQVYLPYYYPHTYNQNPNLKTSKNKKGMSDQAPSPHSIPALSAARTGGRKVPKQYRKYRQKTSSTKEKKEKGHVASRVVQYLIKTLEAFGR